MRTSDTVDALVAALVAARPKFKPVVRDATGQVGQNRQYKYADLAGVLDAIMPALTGQGLAVLQAVEAETATLVTRLYHVSGQWVEQRYPLGTYDRPQELGSALTYARRYSLLALACVAQEDDDAHEAQQAERKPAAQPASHPAPPPPAAQHGTPSTISDAQRRRFYAKAKEAGWEDDALKAWLARRYGFTSTSAITRDKYDEICAAVQAPDADEPDAPNAPSGHDEKEPF